MVLTDGVGSGLLDFRRLVDVCAGDEREGKLPFCGVHHHGGVDFISEREL